MRAIQGLGSATAVSIVFSLFLVGFLGAGWPFAIGASIVLSLGIVAVVASRSTDSDRAADEAWRLAAPDLPPTSDRQSMEQAQSVMPGPDKPASRRKAG
jgi:hypothetical protein